MEREREIRRGYRTGLLLTWQGGREGEGGGDGGRKCVLVGERGGLERENASPSGRSPRGDA